MLPFRHLVLRRPLNRPQITPSPTRSLCCRQLSSRRTGASQLVFKLGPRPESRPEPAAPSKPPSPRVKHIDSLKRRVLPDYVPCAPPRTRHRYRRMGRVAFEKLTRRTKRTWARKTNRRRRRVKRDLERIRADAFQVSRLVMDLDAIDCPAVRPYSARDEIEQTERWRAVPEMDALFKRMVRVKSEIETSKTRWQAALTQYDPKRITERDVLAVAFLGAPHDTDVASNAHVAAQAPPLGYVTRGVLGSIGVTSRIAEDPHHTVHMLLHRLRHQSPPTPARGPRCDEFLDTLAKAYNVAHVQRLVAPLLHADWGRQLVSGCGTEIMSACARTNALPRGDRAWRVYEFLKNLSVALAAEGLRFDLSRNSAVWQLEGRLLGQHSKA